MPRYLLQNHIMHNIFTVAELLRLILENLGRGDLVKCALVCQGWSEIALDLICYEVHDLGKFAGLLAPIKVINPGWVQTYVRPFPLI